MREVVEQLWSEWHSPRRYGALAARTKCALHGGRELLVHLLEVLGRPPSFPALPAPTDCDAVGRLLLWGSRYPSCRAGLWGSIPANAFVDNVKRPAADRLRKGEHAARGVPPA